MNWVAEHLSFFSGEKKRLKFVVSILIFLFLSATFYGQDSRKEFLRMFIKGKYIIVGKKINSNETYTGTMIIHLKGDTLLAERKIGEKPVYAIGEIVFSKSDSIPFLRLRFMWDGNKMEITYMIHSDADNYPRLTGYVYYDDKETKDPGLEALFGNPALFH